MEIIAIDIPIIDTATKADAPAIILLEDTESFLPLTTLVNKNPM